MRDSGVVCDTNPYPWYPSGEHIARVIRARRYRHPLLKAWKCDLELQLLDGGDFGMIHAFLHLGRGDKPHAGRNSNFYIFWVMANGGQPRKRQIMSERAFVGAIFRVRIDDVTTTFSGQDRGQAGVYSICRLISFLEKPCTMKPGKQLTTQPSKACRKTMNIKQLSEFTYKNPPDAEVEGA